MARRALACLAVAGLLAAGPASAATLVIDYDLTGTTFDVTDPITLAIPSDQISGTVSLAFAADDLGNILLDGSSDVTLLALDVVMDLDLDVMGLVTITSPVPVLTHLVAPVTGGTVSSGGLVSFAGSPDAVLDVDGLLDCQAPFGLCGIADLSTGSNPIDETIVQPFADLGTSLAQPDVLTGTMSVTVPVTGDFNLLATETSRTLLGAPASVPEPRVAALLACAGLAAAGRSRRPARRA